ncbi:hypothetical protein ADUPG1_012213, partial [Aduncisulcus paluster]
SGTHAVSEMSVNVLQTAVTSKNCVHNVFSMARKKLDTMEHEYVRAIDAQARESDRILAIQRRSLGDMKRRISQLQRNLCTIVKTDAGPSLLSRFFYLVKLMKYIETEMSSLSLQPQVKSVTDTHVDVAGLIEGLESSFRKFIFTHERIVVDEHTDLVERTREEMEVDGAIVSDLRVVSSKKVAKEQQHETTMPEKEERITSTPRTLTDTSTAEKLIFSAKKKKPSLSQEAKKKKEISLIFEEKTKISIPGSGIGGGV